MLVLNLEEKHFVIRYIIQECCSLQFRLSSGRRTVFSVLFLRFLEGSLGNFLQSYIRILLCIDIKLAYNLCVDNKI